MCNFTTSEIVVHFFKFLELYKEIKIDGLIIFEEASRSQSETKLLLYLKSRQEEPFELKGHSVPAAVKQLGLSWEKLNLLTFIDPSHRAGANIDHKKGTFVLILVGPDLNISDKVQGVLRGRGVLKGEERVIWGIAEKLAPTIASPISPEAIQEWELGNEAQYIDNEYKLYVIQTIDYLVAAPVWRTIDAVNDPAEEIELWHRYRSGLVERADNDLVNRFKREESNSGDTKSMLWAYAARKYATFNFPTPWKEATDLHKQLAPLIQSAAQRDFGKNIHSIDVRQQTHVHTYQKTAVKTILKTNVQSNIEAEQLEPLPSWLTVHEEHFVTDLIPYCRSACVVFKSQFLTQNLWFTSNAIRVARSGEYSLLEEYLKPALYLIVVKKNEIWHAFVLSDKEAELFQKQLMESKLPPHQIALLNSDGGIAQNGWGKSAFTGGELQTQFIYDIVIDVGLTNCQLYHPNRFVERIVHWHDFWPMWTKIKEAQATPPNTGCVQTIESRVPKQIKRKVAKEDTTPKSSSWFGQFF